MALADPTDRRVARHFADGLEAVRHERGLGPEARRRSRRLAPSVSPSDDDDVEAKQAHLRRART